MLEFFIALAVIIFSFIILYREMPKESPHFKMLFFGMALFSMVVMVFSLFTIEDITTTSVYSSNGSYLGVEVVNQTSSSAIKSTALVISQVLMYMIAIILFIITLMWVYGTYKDIVKKKKDKTDIFENQGI
jgi:uncharacterized BrkB/YihY/UPF0761 family membrane protein